MRKALPRSVLVWPAWQRLLHWALATAVIVALVTHEGGKVHEASGYAALALALARIALGIEIRLDIHHGGPRLTDSGVG